MHANLALSVILSSLTGAFIQRTSPGTIKKHYERGWTGITFPVLSVPFVLLKKPLSILHFCIVKSVLNFRSDQHVQSRVKIKIVIKKTAAVSELVS